MSDNNKMLDNVVYINWSQLQLWF